MANTLYNNLVNIDSISCRCEATQALRSNANIPVGPCPTCGKPIYINSELNRQIAISENPQTTALSPPFRVSARAIYTALGSGAIIFLILLFSAIIEPSESDALKPAPLTFTFDLDTFEATKRIQSTKEKPIKTRRERLNQSAKDTWIKFLSSPTINERLSLILSPERTSSDLSHYYRLHSTQSNIEASIKKHMRTYGIKLLATESAKDDALGIAILSLPREILGRPFPVFFKEQEGTMRLDWETFRQHMNSETSHFFAGNSVRFGVFRLALKRESDGTFTTKGLANELPFPIILLPKSSLEKKLAKELPVGEKRFATVRIERQSSNPAWEITNLICWNLQGFSQP